MPSSTRPFGNDPNANEIAKKGGLPPKVRARARALMKANPGWDLSHAIAVALSQYKKELGKGSAKAAKPVAAWTALKARMNAD